MGTGADARASVAVEGGIREVLDLGVADFLFGVDDEDVACNGVHDEGIGNGGAYIAGAQDGNFGGEFGVLRHGKNWYYRYS